MKTEELRETMRRPLIDFAKEYNDIWPSYGTYGQFLGRKGICEDKCIAQILKACKKAGLVILPDRQEMMILLRRMKMEPKSSSVIDEDMEAEAQWLLNQLAKIELT